MTKYFATDSLFLKMSMDRTIRWAYSQNSVMGTEPINTEKITALINLNNADFSRGNRKVAEYQNSGHKVSALTRFDYNF